MRLMQNSMWREVLAEEVLKPPYLVMIMNVGIYSVLSRCGSPAGFGQGCYMELPPTIASHS